MVCFFFPFPRPDHPSTPLPLSSHLIIRRRIPHAHPHTQRRHPARDGDTRVTFFRFTCGPGDVPPRQAESGSHLPHIPALQLVLLQAQRVRALGRDEAGEGVRVFAQEAVEAGHVPGEGDERRGVARRSVGRRVVVAGRAGGGEGQGDEGQAGGGAGGGGGGARLFEDVTVVGGEGGGWVEEETWSGAVDRWGAFGCFVFPRFSPTHTHAQSHPSASVFRPAATKKGWGRLVDLGEGGEGKVGERDTTPKKQSAVSLQHTHTRLSHAGSGSKGQCAQTQRCQHETVGREEGGGRAERFRRRKRNRSGLLPAAATRALSFCCVLGGGAACGATACVCATGWDPPFFFCVGVRKKKRGRSCADASEGGGAQGRTLTPHTRTPPNHTRAPPSQHACAACEKQGRRKKGKRKDKKGGGKGGDACASDRPTATAPRASNSHASNRSLQVAAAGREHSGRGDDQGVACVCVGGRRGGVSENTSEKNKTPTSLPPPLSLSLPHTHQRGTPRAPPAPAWTTPCWTAPRPAAGRRPGSPPRRRAATPRGRARGVDVPDAPRAAASPPSSWP